MAIGGQGTAAVKAEPTDPQHGGADEVHGHIVRGHQSFGRTLAFADEDRGDQGGCASGDVHDDAAGKVEDAHRAEEAGLAPNHMGDRHVDQQTPQAAEPHDGREFHAFGKGADKESRRNDGEGHLEDKEQQFGDRPHKCFTGDAQEEGLGKLPIKGLLAVKARL